MKISNRIVSKFQEGGPMPAGPEAGAAAPAASPEGGAPAGPEGGAQDPIMQIAEMAAQALQSQDCQASMAVCEAFLSLLQGTAGGPEGGAPAPAPAEGGGAPVFAKGGKLINRR